MASKRTAVVAPSDGATTETAEKAELSTVEVQRLTSLEVVIEKGLATFMDVGGALLEIRNKRLYRATHKTFEEYVRARWGFSARRARQLVEATEIGKIVPLPNDAQARELLPLRDDPEAIKAVVEEAKRETGGRPTAKVIRERVQQRVQARAGRTPATRTRPAAAPAPSPDKVRAQQEAEEREADEALAVVARAEAVLKVLQDIDPGQLRNDLVKLPPEHYLRVAIAEWVRRLSGEAA